jgi:hypothetical protein
MRAPEAALVRARAKAPLPELLVLHLSSADIECVKHLELCKSLQSLYADSNSIKDLEGVVALRKLWRIDLNANLLRNLHTLASFRALGFLHLERNRLRFDNLVCLRDQHILELRLLGNEALLEGNTIEEYRTKVVALLPNVWILDGHFITTAERQHAIDEFDPFVVDLLKQPQTSAVAGSKFGSATDVWVESELVVEDTDELNRTASLIEVAHKSRHPSEPPDLRRLYAVVSFHNAESVLHNSHCHFAPSRHAPTARRMPKIWLDEVLALPRRTRFEVLTLLAVFLEFRFPKLLLSEALTIRLLDSPHFPSEAIRDLANLPPYAIVALVAIVRHSSTTEEQALRDALKPEVSSPEFESESDLLGAIPALFTTLTSSRTGIRDEELEATTRRCQRAIKLLSNVASYPDLETLTCKGNGKRQGIFRELLPLIRAAEADPVSQNGRQVIVPCLVASTHPSGGKSPTGRSFVKARKRSETSQSCGDSSDTATATPSLPTREQVARQYVVSLDRARATGSVALKKPKPGDWVEVCLKQFAKIQFLSADGLFVVGALSTDASRTITISLEQMSRVSNSAWRVDNLTKLQTEELSARTPSSTSDNNTRLGKLHRDSEAFHHHGAARNQGFPNHFVTRQVLRDLDRERRSPQPSLGQAKAVEVFSANDTLDANYVLTSPEHISAQNFCAASAFLQQRRAPQGLWRPMKQPAPYSVLGSSQAASMGKSSSLRELKTRKPRAAQCTQQQPDDWLEIRRAMQAQLGIEDSSSNVDSSSIATPSAPDDCNSYEVDAPVERQELTARSEEISQRSRLKTPPLASAGGAKLASSRAWHHVATRTEFVVADPTLVLGASHSAPLLRSAVPAAAALPKQPSMLKLVLPSLPRTHKR